MLKMDKSAIAKIFEEMALLLELKGDNPFKVRAYLTAARTLLGHGDNLEEMLQQGTLTELEGIGKDLAEKIEQLAKTGHLDKYEELKSATPPGLLKMMEIHGLGGKKIKTLYEKLGIKTLQALKQACLNGTIANLKGFGEKTQSNILEALSHQEAYKERHLWWDAMAIAAPILEQLKKQKGVVKAEIGGSLRRKLETIGDLDFLVAASNPSAIMNWFTSQKFVSQILAKGETKSSVLLKNEIQADLRIVSEKEWAFALCYFTGSKEHNIKLRQMAQSRGWKLNEWGMTSQNSKVKGPFDAKKKEVTESDLYEALGLVYMEPELRENREEFEAAKAKKLPFLVEEKDIRGTFHVHTTESDGKSTLEEVASAAQKRGWEYLGISDHSKASFQANGLNEERLEAQMEQIWRLNKSKKYKVHLFAGLECDILSNGTLDCSNEMLKALDFVIVSVHASLQQDEATMTKRLIRAIEHPYSTMVGHVTGRLLLKREAYAVNVRKVIDACIANGKIMELNAHPMRLDMDWRFWHAASEKGLLCCINPDAHHAQDLQYVQAGVNCARKGWLEKDSVFNTLSLKEVMKKLKKMKG